MTSHETLRFEPTAPDLGALLPDLRGRRVLVVGLGGGADIVTAFAVSRALDVGDGVAVYANAKNRAESDLPRLSPHVARVPDAPVALAQLRAKQGSTGIDRAVPRGPDGCPLVCVLPASRDDGALARELAALRFDHVVAVDTGGDALEPTRGRKAPGRDARMLAVVRAVGVPVQVVVVAPGADGQNPPERLAAWFREASRSFRGSTTVDALLPVYRDFAAHLSPTRTPCLVVAAAEAASRGATTFVVPRGCTPVVPIAWMTTALVFDGAL